MAGQRYFPHHFLQPQSVLVICKELDPVCQWACAGHLRAGHSSHSHFLGMWAGLFCSWFILEGGQAHSCASVMSQQGAHVTVFTHSSVSTPFARITLHDIQNYTELCCAGVILVIADHFGIGLCFQLFLLCFQLLIAQLAVEILSFKEFDVLY